MLPHADAGFGGGCYLRKEVDCLLTANFRDAENQLLTNRVVCGDSVNLLQCIQGAGASGLADPEDGLGAHLRVLIDFGNLGKKRGRFIRLHLRYGEDDVLADFLVALVAEGFPEFGKNFRSAALSKPEDGLLAHLRVAGSALVLGTRNQGADNKQCKGGN